MSINYALHVAFAHSGSRHRPSHVSNIKIFRKALFPRRKSNTPQTTHAASHNTLQFTQQKSPLSLSENDNEGHKHNAHRFCWLRVRPTCVSEASLHVPACEQAITAATSNTPGARTQASLRARRRRTSTRQQSFWARLLAARWLKERIPKAMAHLSTPFDLRPHSPP